MRVLLLFLTCSALGQVPVIDQCLYTPRADWHCACPPGGAVGAFQLSFISTETPVWVQKSTDLRNWTTVFGPMSTTNHARWIWGEQVNEPRTFYRLAGSP